MTQQTTTEKDKCREAFVWVTTQGQKPAMEVALVETASAWWSAGWDAAVEADACTELTWDDAPADMEQQVAEWWVAGYNAEVQNRRDDN